MSNDAIAHALRALRKRHLVEEAAHQPAFTAISRPSLSLGQEWKEKAAYLESDLQECYKAQARLSEQLVVEVAESRALKPMLQEKETKILDLQKHLSRARDECSNSTALLHCKSKAVELLLREHQDLKVRLVAEKNRGKNAEGENRMMIDRWMLQEMQDAKRHNQANAVHEDAANQIKIKSIEQFSSHQVDGIVRQIEDGAERYSGTIVPSMCLQRISAHAGGCAAIMFEYSSSKLVSGGQDRAVKKWDMTAGSAIRSFPGCLGSVLDLTITPDNKFIIAASGSNNLCVWDAGSGRLCHSLTGHRDKVWAVDVGQVYSSHVVSAAYDRTIKVWDLQKGYIYFTIN